MIPFIPLDLPPVEDAVRASLVEWVEESCAAARTEVHWLGITPASVPRGDAYVWQGRPCKSNPRLQLLVVDDEEVVSRFTVQPSLTVWVHAPVAPVDYATGQRVEPVLGIVDIAQITGTPTTRGGEARVAIRSGQPVTNMNVRQPIDAQRGSTVTIEIVRKSLSITTPGQLMDNGRAGDTVRVINHSTKQVLEGVLIDAQTVRLR